MGAKLRVLVADPEGSVLDMIAFRSTSRTPTHRQRDRIYATIADIRQLKANIPEADIQLRSIDYMPPYGLTIMKHREHPAKNICWARLFTFQTPTPNAPLINPDPSQDAEWFNFFTEQFWKMWDQAQHVDLN